MPLRSLCSLCLFLPSRSFHIAPDCRGRGSQWVSRSLAGALLLGGIAFSASGGFAAPDPAAPAAKPDVLIYNNGDQLTGKFLRSAGNTVTFHSDMAGDVNVGWDKIKELRSATVYAVFEKGQHLTRRPEKDVPEGTLTLADQKIELKQESGETKEIEEKNTDFVIDAATFEQQIHHGPNIFHGWLGNVTGGASLVEATQSTTTFNGSMVLVRMVPSVSWLLPRNRTTMDFNGSYGKITQPQAAGAPSLPDVKTAVYHADAERDEYFSPRFYVLGEVAFDHNFSQGLDLQQIYGGGVGVTIVKRPRANLDLKATVQYEEQVFIDAASGTDQNLIGSTFSESYLLKLPHNIVLTEQGAYLPAYNNMHDYSANENSNIGFPLYKRLSFSVGTIDTYLNDPPLAIYPAPINKRNSFEFTTGVTYSLGPH